MTELEREIFRASVQIYIIKLSSEEPSSQIDKVLLGYQSVDEAKMLFQHVKDSEVQDETYSKGQEFLRSYNQHRGDQRAVCRELGISQAAFYTRKKRYVR